MKNLVKHSSFLVILLVILFSCKTQKSSVEYKYIYKTDTLIRSEIKTIYKGVTDTISIDNPCDSVGIINNFYSKLVLPNGTITIRSERGTGKLKALVKINDAVSDIRSEAKSRTSESVITKEKEVIKYRIPSWVIYILIIETLSIALYVYLRLQNFIK